MERTAHKTNLLFFLIQLDTGGTEQVVLELVRNLNRSKFNVYVGSFFGGSLEKPFTESCARLFRVRKTSSGVDLRSILQIYGILRDYSIDVVNAHHFLPYLYCHAGALVNRSRLIYTEHSVPEVLRVAQGPTRSMCSLMMHSTDAFLGVSKEVSTVFGACFPAHCKKVIQISNAVNINRFTEVLPHEGLRKVWGLSDQDFIIGCIANFRRVKNHACLIHAMKHLVASHPEIRLVLVGQGFPKDMENSEEEVRNLVRNLNLDRNVVFAGYRQDVPQLMKLFDAFCLPSLSEGMPVSLLEAMAAKVPVIASNVRGIREVIFHEQTGLLFANNDSHELAQGLQRLIEDPELRHALRREAFIHVQVNHGLEQWVAAYEKLFLERHFN